MKSFAYTIGLFVAFFLIKSALGFGAALGAMLIALLVVAWNRRGQLLTHLATQAYYVKGDVEKGEKLFQKAYKSGLMNPQGKIAYSSFCLRENRFDKGRRLLNEVINSSRSTKDEKVGARHNLAVLTWREGNLAEAISILEEVHADAPATNSFATLGVLYIERAKETGEYESLLSFMQEAYEYNADDKTIADNLGELYILLSDYEKAKGVYTKLLEKEFITPVPYYNYGVALRETGDIDGARKYFEKALSCRFTSVLTLTREKVQEEIDALN